MTRLIGISGSLRQGSFNTALLRSACQLAPRGGRIEARSIRDIPLYDGDVEDASGIPPAVSQLKEAIAAAHGLLLVTPEYNNSLPGVLKNAIDWLSRPSADIRRVFGGKPVAVIGTSTGSFGTVLSQNAWLPVLRALGCAPWFGGRLVIPHAAQIFDARGDLTDDGVRSRLQQFIAGFVEHIERTASHEGLLR